jgi:hypothetical protein
MKLDSALKTSLDELRMQMLGAQVLFGFQFQGLFQDAFQSLPASGRAADAAALALMTAVLALLLAVPSQHRIVEGGEDTLRIFHLSSRYATCALAPLAAAIACDVYVAMSPSFGSGSSIVATAAAFLFAIGAWYGIGFILRQPRHSPMQEIKISLHAKIEQMLTEARVILPGAQALLGFQLVVMMTDAFRQLTSRAQGVHLAALLSLVVSIVLLITPAALHRLAFDGRDDPQLHRLGSLVITIALLPLAAAIACDIWVALYKLYGAGVIPQMGAVLAASLLLGFWYCLPLILRRAHRLPKVGQH